ncbi:CD99 molecule isoform X5 [Oryzias melastigma]|uniref:CD99 molecule isoform X5 n=1 Tax=Oryzias melastigma TaxID=30732 RepID=UPI000CF8238F|nr:CD99 molecule isoform X5 [Oryzias melastigma]
MKTLVITASLLVFISGTRTEDFGFNLADALDEPSPAPTPKDPPKAPEKPGSDDGFSLEDALLPDPKTTKKPSAPSGGGGGGGSFSDDDLLNTLDDGYKPDKTGSGGRAADSNFDSAGGADQPQDPDPRLAQLLKTLYALLPEEVLVWMSDVKQVLQPLLERGVDLLQNLV